MFMFLTLIESKEFVWLFIRVSALFFRLSPASFLFLNWLYWSNRFGHCKLHFEGHEFVDHEPRMIASCIQFLYIDSGKATQIGESSLGLGVADSKLSIFIETSSIDVAFFSLNERVVVTSSNLRDAHTLKVNNLFRFLLVVSVLVSKLATVSITEGE